MDGWMVEAWKYRYASEEESHTPYVAVNRCGFCVLGTSTVTLMQVDGPNVTVRRCNDKFISHYSCPYPFLLPYRCTDYVDDVPPVSTTTFACIVPQDLPSEKYALYV